MSIRQRARNARNRLHRFGEWFWGGIELSKLLKNPWAHYLDLIPSDDVGTLRYKNGLTMLYRRHTKDMEIHREIMACNHYGRELRLFGSYAPPLRNVIDAGAQTGVFACKVLKANPDCHVTCVEMHGKNASLLSRNIALNGFSPRTTILANALWSTTGETVKYSIHPTNTGAHSVVKQTSDVMDIARTISLADVVGDTRWDLLKMDIEGAEYEVLFKAPENIFQQIHMIVLELHGDNPLGSIEKLLTDRGYAVGRFQKIIYAFRK